MDKIKKHIMYKPLTATPFKQNNAYSEVAPTSPLQPYIRCFWGTERPYIQGEVNEEPELVIPDTCVDIIYNIDYTDNTVTGGFCGVNDSSFCAGSGRKVGHLVATFAIRFYAWSAYVFAEDSLKDTVNGYFEVGERFEWLDTLIRLNLLEMKTLEEKISFVEHLFLDRFLKIRENAIVNTALNTILANKGTMDISDLAKETFVSSRQLERLFHEYVGIAPKKLSNLVRYQFLWRDILLQRDFTVLDAVHKYRYTDQSHLLREFKRYHSMDIHRAREFAFSDVGNIQETHIGL